VIEADLFDLAWAAGLFEGEGCISVRRSSKYVVLRCAVAMTDEEAVRFFHERWNGSVHYRDYKASQKPAWAWEVNARLAASFLTDLLPFFRTQRVRRKAELALEFQAQKLRGGAVRWQADLGGYNARQHEYADLFAVLNMKGRGAHPSTQMANTTTPDQSLSLPDVCAG
jgi:hypothetical protein